MSDLELVSDADLLVELMVRHEHAVFAGMKPGCADGNRYSYMVKGNHATVMGLCTYACMKSYEDLKETETDQEEPGDD